ncbi:hypothetical protein [Nitratireductor sp. GZWM139]|uniref:hypothetical protein n=1 Tax=Nitratireductor sp. GZWM139 TaxID=2950541 RepID=UPI0024BDC4C5|nr:hypothetical protein [Nitratireductor sp. GZWM139]MDJ1463416.1 hypothetical protein [Nitratireductor sp. GZWM139]
MARFEKGKLLHCVETVTGKHLTGTLLVSEDEIRAHIYSYSDFFHIKSEQPVFLIAESGHVVSFHANVDNGFGTTSFHEQETHYQGIVANVAVIGHDPWTEIDRVKRVSFAVKHTMDLLHHQKKVKALGRSKFPAEEHFRIFEVAAKGITLRAWYRATYGIEFGAPKALWPSFEIEFDEPQNIHDFIEHVSNYLAFLSFCLGVKLRPHDIRIDRLSHAEVMAGIKARTYVGEHEVHYIWPETEIDVRDLWVGGSPVRAWDEEELVALCACLTAWMDRAGDWKKSYVMMMTSFGFKGVISAERLINACKWFEELPNAKSNNALSPKDIEAITAAAAAKAEQLGHASTIRERIATSIARVKEETAAERFTRLMALVEERFGKGIFPGNAISHLRRAIQFRGRTAHGHFHPASADEYRAFSKSTRAMEALCYLLNALDLPISPDGAERVRNNPLVRDYHEAYE